MCWRRNQSYISWECEYPVENNTWNISGEQLFIFPMSHTCTPALRLTHNWSVLWRTIFSLNLGKSYAIINMKEQLPLQHQSIWSFKKPVMMSDFWHLGLRKLASIPSFSLGLIYSPSFCFPELRTPGTEVCQQWQKGWDRGRENVSKNTKLWQLCTRLVKTLL